MSNKELKTKYKHLVQLVKEVVDQWDPIDLLAFCPPDEYDIEIKSICAMIQEDMDEDELAKVIQTIFTEYFGSDTFDKNFHDCRIVAKTIKDKLSSLEIFPK